MQCFLFLDGEKCSSAFKLVGGAAVGEEAKRRRSTVERMRNLPPFEAVSRSQVDVPPCFPAEPYGHPYPQKPQA